MKNEIEYKQINGTFYHKKTPSDLCEVLENCRANRTRIQIDFGDVATGLSWNEEFDNKGYLGRSTGSIKVPLLLYNSRSSGGSALLDHCILSVKTTKGNQPLYQLKNNN